MTKFYEEGAHLGLRKYVEDGVTYHCPPQHFIDFKALCQSAPSYKNTVLWVFRPDYLGGWIFAHVFCPGNKNWFKKSWPEVLKLQNQRYLILYYPAGAVHELSDADDEFDEASLEHYQSGHSLLCLIFDTKSPAAFDISLGKFASTDILEIVSDPYLGVSSPGFGGASLQIAGLCVKKGKTLKKSPLRQRVLELLANLAKAYPQLESAMVEDADYMYEMTYPLMPLTTKSIYGALVADFEAAMKDVAIESAEEIATIARQLDTEDCEISLHADREDPDDRERYSIEVVRQYLVNARPQEHMSLEAFDALLQISEKIDGKPSDVVQIAELKTIAREWSGKLTEIVQATGAFPITGALMAALMEVGYIRSEGRSSDYRDLIYRTKANRPWLRTPAKFVGDTCYSDKSRREFLAYCRIITGR